MDARPRWPTLLRRAWPVAVAALVLAVLLAARARPRSDAPGVAFAPPTGRFHSEVVASDGGHFLVPIDIERLRGGRYEIRMPWTPPEPDVWGTPPDLLPFAGRIPIRVLVTSFDGVEDILGPDEVLDPLDATDPGASDRIRALHIEEQVDAVLAWQMTAYMAQPLVEEARFTVEASFPGLGALPDWSGNIDYEAGPSVPCPPIAGKEKCIQITLHSRPEPDGRVELSGRLLVGERTGVEWEATLARDTGSRRREVTRRLVERRR